VGIEPIAGTSRASGTLQTKENSAHNFGMLVIALPFKGKAVQTALAWKIRTKEERPIGYVFFFFS